MATSDFVTGGYLVTKFVNTASYNSWMMTYLKATEDLLPAKILSVGLCGAPRAPIFGWATSLAEDYAQFGIPDRLPELDNWANQRFNTEIGYPDIFFYLSTAIEYVRRFTSDPDIQILGMGLHVQDLPLIREAELLRPASLNANGAVNAGFPGTNLPGTQAPV